ncbi:MAG: protein-disulfide reductase DsbD family protein [bacterium]|nr:protein-disulfide reductase DsbD family protein [bacterium]
MPRLRQPIVPLLLVLLACGCAREAGPGPRARDGAVAVELLTAEKAAVPGRILTLGWRFRIDEGWHLYWHGVSDTGVPPSVALTLPAGWEAGPLRWPAPSRHVSPGDILDHVYVGEVVLLQTVRVAADAPLGGRAEIRARLDWLACSENCAPGSAELVLSLPVERHAGPTPDADAITRVFQGLPQPLPEGLATVALSGAELSVAVPGAGRLEFYPLDSCGPLVAPLADAAVDGGALRLRLRERDGHVGPVRGILYVRSGDGAARSYEMNIAAAPVAVSPKEGP